MIRRLLRLPEGDPPLPEGDPDSVSVWKPSPGYLRYRLALFVFAGLPALLGFGAFLTAGAVSVFADGGVPAVVQGVMVAGLLLVGLRILVGIVFGVVKIRLEMEMLRYVLTDQALRLRRGVTSIEEITLSFANIQNVKLSQDFTQRIFGISDLIVETAGGGGSAEVGGHVGRIIGVGEAEALRDAINTRARAFKGSGLGRSTRSATPTASVAASGGLSSPEAVALLREITDDLRAIQLRPQG